MGASDDPLNATAFTSTTLVDTLLNDLVSFQAAV
jgi:hypothetical protein